MNELLTMLDTKYKRLEYIQSTGTQWIDTGLMSVANEKASYSFELTQAITTDTKGISGSYVLDTSTTPSNYLGCIRASDKKLNYRVGTNFVACGDDIELNKKYNVEVDIQSNSQSMTCNGTTATSSYSSNATNVNITIFNINGLKNSNFIGKIYYFKLWQNETLVRNFVPVLRKSDNEIGMLDLVEGKFYPNAGTGKFTANLDTMYALIQGTPTVQDGMVSGFSSSNYLKTPAFTPGDKSWEIVCKFTTGTITNFAGIITGLGTIDSIAPLCISSQGFLAFYASSNGSSWNIANSASILKLQNNTTYIIKIEFTGSAYNAYSFENNEWVLKTTINNPTPIYGTIPLIFGNNRGTGDAFNGSIDLNRSYIKIDDTKYKLQAVVGYTKVGTLTENPTGVFSGFTNNDNIQTLQSFVDNGQNFEFGFRVKTPTTANFSGIFSVGSTGYSAIVNFRNNKTIAANIIRGYGSISSPMPYILTKELELDTWYYIKWKRINNVHTIYHSIDGINYIAGDSVTCSDHLYNNGGICIYGWHSAYSSNGYAGSIDLENTYIKINNKLWFNGLEA